MSSIYEILSPNGHSAMVEEIFTKIKSYLDTHGVDSKVSKSGDTMTGKLTVSGASVQVNNSLFTIFNDTVDLTKSNNGISENVGRYFRFLDKNSKLSGMVTNAIKTDGGVTTNLSCRNYKTNGDYVSNTVSLSVAKNGTRSVEVSDASVWRTALGLGTMATQNTGSYYTQTNIDTKIPSGVVIRTGTVVRTLNGPAGSNLTIFSQSQLNSLTGKTNRGQANTAVLLSDGDITAHIGTMTYQGFSGNKYIANFSAAYSDQLFRFNYIIASW